MQKIFSLRLKKDINFVFKKGEKCNSHTFFLKYVYGGKNFFRYGIVVSSKVSKKAIIRNKIRRQIKEIIRKNQKTIPPVDFMVFVQKESLEKTFKEKEKEILFLLDKIKTKE